MSPCSSDNFCLFYGDEFAAFPNTFLLEISFQIVHVHVSPAYCIGCRQYLLLTAGWLHPHRADTEAEATRFIIPVVAIGASLKLRQDWLNLCGAVVTFQLRIGCTRLRLSSPDEDCWRYFRLLDGWSRFCFSGRFFFSYESSLGLPLGFRRLRAYIFRTDVGRESFDVDKVNAGCLSVDGDCVQVGSERLVDD